MRRLVLCLALLLAPSLAIPAEPQPKILGPATAVVGDRVLFDVSGSVSDSPLQVDAAGPEKPQLRLWYDEAAKPGLLVVTPTRPGSYTIVVVAIGKGDPAPLVRIATAPLEITLPQPAPNPTPGPGPSPGPEPPTPPIPPGPGPVVSGKLWAVYVVPDLPSPAESALRTSPTLRSQFDGANNFWKSYLASQTEVSAAGWKQAVAAAGGPPVVLWVTEGGKIVKSTKAPTEAATVADLKALRGVR